jgi:hypothetical protein
MSSESEVQININEENTSEESVEAESEVSFTNTKDIVLYFIDKLRIVVYTFIISIGILFYLYNKPVPLWKKIILILFPLVLTFIYLFIKHSPNPKKQYFLSVLFGDKPIITNYKHNKENKKGEKLWPFSGSAVLNVNDTNYIFIGNGYNNSDALLVYNEKTNNFDDVIENTILNSKESTYSAVSFDMDKNGLEDLIVGRSDGVTLYKQISPLKFKAIKIMDKLDKEPLALSVSDFNHDGKPDVYVSYFTPLNKYRGTIFNDSSHNRQNMLLQNNTSSFTGKTSFTDVTVKTNAGGKHNTFTSAFVDLNNDTWPDLVLSNDSGEVEVLQNIQGKKFISKNIAGKGNWMGLGIGDIDNDGKQDLFLTNVGADIDRDRISKGDIRKDQKQKFAHVLLSNKGDFEFVDVTKEKGVSGDGFGWGAILADLNLDGSTDLLFGENFQLYPFHWIFPGVAYFYSLINDKYKRQFEFKNPHFAQTPMHVDVNKDGRKDVVWINMDGPATVYLNKSQNNYLNIKLPQTVEFVNAKVMLDTGSKKMYQENIQGGVGFGGDHGNIIQFGLGKVSKIKEIRVYTMNNKQYSLKTPKINSTVTMKKFEI